MSTLFEQLIKQAPMLTPQEKASLARILIEELDTSSDTDVEQLWIEESQRRYEAYLRGELKSVPGEEVMSRYKQVDHNESSVDNRVMKKQPTTSKETKVERPRRAQLTREEVLKRMKEFPERKEQFLATARTRKN